MILSTIYLLIFLVVYFLILQRKSPGEIVYPIANRNESVEDDYNGVKIKDPYRWLEDPNSPETIDYVNQLNNVTIPFIKSSPYYSELKEELNKLWNYPKYKIPFRIGKRYFHYYNSGLQNQYILYVRNSLDDEPRVFLDPNSWSTDGTLSLSKIKFSEDGTILAFAKQKSGSDWNVVQFMTVDDAKLFPDILYQVKFSDLSWTHDNQGVFYSMFPENDGDDGRKTTILQNHKLMYHKLGEAQTKDIVCYEDVNNPNVMIFGQVTDCGRYLLVHISNGNNETYLYSDLKNRFKPQIDKFLTFHSIINFSDASLSYITNNGTEFIFQTTLNASMGKIVQINLENIKQENWKDLISTKNETLLEWATAVNKSYLVVCHLEDVKHTLTVYHLWTGKEYSKIPIGNGSIVEFVAHDEDNLAFFSFTSYQTPTIIYSCDFSKSPIQIKIHSETKVNNIDFSVFQVLQVSYRSKDGTKIPMYIVKHKNTVLDGNNPCLLYGYGGFSISLMPGFSIMAMFWLKYFRGVYAVPNIRGGGEYGKAWHDGGRLGNKQNVFDDFLSAAEYLIQNNYTNNKKLAIMGGSNGGLLVAASMLQRPDLFGAVIGQVGVYDMLRFNKFTIGHAWVEDYGNPENPKHFEWLKKYSPLHNVRGPTNSSNQYPALLLLTADHDDRVVPLHSLKFIAELHHKCYKNSFQKNPLLIRIEVNAGHGSGKPTSKNIEENRDIFAFLQLTLDLKWYN